MVILQAMAETLRHNGLATGAVEAVRIETRVRTLSPASKAEVQHWLKIEQPKRFLEREASGALRNDPIHPWNIWADKHQSLINATVAKLVGASESQDKK